MRKVIPIMEFRYYIIDFLERASRIKWIVKDESKIGYIYYPSETFCQGFVISNTYDSTKRRIGLNSKFPVTLKVPSYEHLLRNNTTRSFFS